jgi:hypothetical protein
VDRAGGPPAWLCSSLNYPPSPPYSALRLTNAALLPLRTIRDPPCNNPPQRTCPSLLRPHHHRLLPSIVLFPSIKQPVHLHVFASGKFAAYLPRGDLARSRSCSPNLTWRRRVIFLQPWPTGRYATSAVSVITFVSVSYPFSTDPGALCRSWSSLQTRLSSRSSNFLPSYLNYPNQQKGVHLFLSPRPPWCNRRFRRRPTTLPQTSWPILPSARRLQSSRSTRLQRHPRRMLTHPRFCRLHRPCMHTLPLMPGTSLCSPRIIFRFSST